MPAVTFTLNGKPVTADASRTIWDVAREHGVDIPVLCHQQRLRPVGVCRMCVVDVKGARVLQASCVRQVENGMVVDTHSPRVEASRRMLTDFLMSDHPTPCARPACELEALAKNYGVHPSYPRRAAPPKDASSPVIAVDHAACILCDRCIRACDEIQGNDVIGRNRRGGAARIGFDFDLPMGDSTCVSCGECAAVCPTGALVHKSAGAPAKTVDTVCPYCGVGCGVTYAVRDNRIVQSQGVFENPGSQGRLCVKGRYGFDYAHHPQRLTVPLIRKTYPKGALSRETQGKPGGLVNYKEVLPHFREATWDEALDLAAQTFKQIRSAHGPKALAGFGSAKCTNEEAYLFQKLIRAVFGTNNVDHCTRLCHASSVAALMETIGSAAVSNVYGDAKHADCIVVIGSNTTENHPVAASFFKQAARAGATLIVIDPRRHDLAKHAHHYVRYKPGTDVAFLNAVMNVIVEENLLDRDFIERRTVGFAALLDTVARYTPEVASKITGVPPLLIRDVARAYGRAKNAMIFWGMGISQHTTGTDNARCLISLCLMTGHIGRPGNGLHPLRGQNNVQGASDAGLIPMVFPGYQSVEIPDLRAKWEKAWGAALDPKRGLTVVEIMAAALAGDVKAMYMMGENPFLSDPNINKVRKALAHLDFLVVQDIFLTETAEFADIILPATTALEKLGTVTNTDRRVQVVRPVLDPPGQARLDWQIICDIASRMGYPMNYDGPEAVWNEMKALVPEIAGISYGKLDRAGVVYPCPTPDHPGSSEVFQNDFPIGRGKFVPAEFAPARELPDRDFPFVLNTGRVLEHWHTGTMTRRAKVLSTIEPKPFVEMNPDDMKSLKLRDGARVRVASRRGEIVTFARASAKSAKGSCFIPFHFREAAANVLTIDALDPFGKIPEYKFCAVRIAPVSSRSRGSRSPRARSTPTDTRR